MIASNFQLNFKWYVNRCSCLPHFSHACQEGWSSIYGHLNEKKGPPGRSNQMSVKPCVPEGKHWHMSALNLTAKLESKSSRANSGSTLSTPLNYRGSISAYFFSEKFCKYFKATVWFSDRTDYPLRKYARSAGYLLSSTHKSSEKRKRGQE